MLLASKNFSVYLQFNAIMTAEKGDVEFKPVTSLPFIFCSLCNIILKWQSLSCNSTHTQGSPTISCPDIFSP